MLDLDGADRDALVALVLAHAGAAFYHHLFQNDDTLKRMLPRRRVSSSPLPKEPSNDVV